MVKERGTENTSYTEQAVNKTVMIMYQIIILTYRRTMTV